MLYGLVAVAALIGWLWLERSNELFVLSWRGTDASEWCRCPAVSGGGAHERQRQCPGNGEMRLVRGVVPGRLRSDFADALKSMKVQSAHLRVKKDLGGASLSTNLDDFEAQWLRNILRLFPLSNLRTGTAPAQNKLLRVFGFSAVLWAFGSRDCDE